MRFVELHSNLYVVLQPLHTNQLMVDLLLPKALQQKRLLLIQQRFPVARQGQPSFEDCKQDALSWKLERTICRDVPEDANFC